MPKFAINDPKTWVSLEVGELYDMHHVRVRKARFDFITDVPSSVFMVLDGDPDHKLIGAGNGGYSIEVTLDGLSALYVSAAEGASISMRDHLNTRVYYADPSKPSFVRIEPRPQSTEMDRMLYLMKQNEVRREQMTLSAIAQLRAQASAQGTTTPDPTPNPDPSEPVVPDPDPEPQEPPNEA